MSRGTKWLIIRTLSILVFAGIAYFFLQDPYKTFEARTAAWIVTSLGSTRVNFFGDSSIYVDPYHYAPFAATVTFSCSSLASALSIICLGAITPRFTLWRRIYATGTAVFLVIFGNIMRITASISIGLIYGRSSLVLFHDWVGSTFTFAYTLGGFMVMLSLLLKRNSPDPIPNLEANNDHLDAHRASPRHWSRRAGRGFSDPVPHPSG